MLNWIIWNRTIYIYKNGYDINNLQLMCHKTKQNQTKPNQTNDLLIVSRIPIEGFSLVWFVFMACQSLLVI